MRIWFDNKDIPVTFISSDHKMIPQLIQALKATKGDEGKRSTFDMNALERIEVVGTEAYLYSKADTGKCYLALY
ncbi:hypothetical protein ACFQ88_35900 [Paenibacillus sp. NPDC056579]|uniref:hypothetical protein n=1 Tax=unclassified Paenibacillus TaxID=185978 RepID=UPI001EF79C47|nr:hypothetical protein [Paenibacillus sp. H1-7]ULL19419.1 hypothetical protein DVH26_36425 [Paenibacillus sp. H1-7]